MNPTHLPTEDSEAKRMPALSRWPWRQNGAAVRPTQTMRFIAQMVADKHGLTIAQMKVRTQRPAVAHPRLEAMAMMHGAGYSHAQAARFFGFKLHASIHAEKFVAARTPPQQEAL